jgi:hypothetical protein
MGDNAVQSRTHQGFWAAFQAGIKLSWMVLIDRQTLLIYPVHLTLTYTDTHLDALVGMPR